jgi:hypothetical protein
MTSTQVTRVRAFVAAAADAGMLGVVAARTSTSEGDLARWLDNDGPIPSERALRQLDAFRAEELESKGGDPYNRMIDHCDV